MPVRRARAAIPLIATALVGAGGAASAEPLIWPRGFVARLEAQTLLQTLNAELLTHDSATKTLTRWCIDHHLDPAGTIVARAIPGADKPADQSVLAVLNAGPDQIVRHRRVELVCGARVLARADNWYLPRLLTREMNRQLDQSNTPFGLVVAPLGFHRRTLSARLLYQPLPDGWDVGTPSTGTEGRLVIPDRVIQHRAVLSTAVGAPFSVVFETYTNQVLPPQPPRVR